MEGSLREVWVGGNGRRPSRIRRPRPACGARAEEARLVVRSSINSIVETVVGGEELTCNSDTCVPVTQNGGFINLTLEEVEKSSRRGRGVSHVDNGVGE